MLIAPCPDDTHHTLWEVRLLWQNFCLHVAQDSRERTVARFCLLDTQKQGHQHLFCRPHTFKWFMLGKTQQLAEQGNSLGAFEEIRAKYSLYIVGREERVQKRKSRKTLRTLFAPGTLLLFAITTGEAAEVL